MSFVLTGLIGFSHTPAGQPYLGPAVKNFYGLFRAAGASCPLGFDQVVSQDQRTERRLAQSSKSANFPKASTREFFNMKMAASTKNEIEAWAKKQNGICKNLKSPFDIECTGPFMGSTTTTFWLEFDDKDQLVTSRGISKFDQLERAGKLFRSLQSSLKKQSKNNLRESSEKTLHDIQLGLLNQAYVVAEFNNLKASVRLTNMGKDFALTHEFLAF